MVGTSKKMIKHIQKNKDKVSYDIERGIITTERGTHGFICSSTGYIRFKLAGKLVQSHTFFGVLIFGSDLEGMTINHKNGNKLDNRQENLEIMTLEDNVKHEWETGLCKGHASHNAMPVAQVDENGKVLNRFDSLEHASRVLLIYPKRIKDVCIGKKKMICGKTFRFE